ncbi:MAG: DNA polymerase IV [Sphingobium sp.]
MDDNAPQTRKIIHIDMDAFYASVEQRDNPDLRGRPVAVGGSGVRGVVAAASYEARTFGVRSAMPGSRARRICPALIFAPPRFDVYRSVSRQIREIFAQFTDVIQPLSLDEAYLDVTESKQNIGSATAIAEEIRRLIRAETGLTASAGVSYNKLIAKLASDQNKPDGICVIRPDQGAAFVAELPVRRFHGIGPVTAKKMQDLGIETGANLRDCPLPFLKQHFGSSAEYYHDAARGVDHRPVRAREVAKSISVEDTFGTDISDRDALMLELDQIIARLWPRIEASGMRGRTVTLKVKFGDFTIITRSRSLPRLVDDAALLSETGRALLDGELPLRMGARLLGLGVHNLEPAAGAGGADPAQLVLAI